MQIIYKKRETQDKMMCQKRETRLTFTRKNSILQTGGHAYEKKDL